MSFGSAGDQTAPVRARQNRFRIHFPPELGGVRPWADTTDRVRLYWRTHGHPDAWPSLVAEWGIDVVTHELTATALLHGRALRCAQLPRPRSLAGPLRGPSVLPQAGRGARRLVGGLANTAASVRLERRRSPTPSRRPDPAGLRR